MKAHEIKDIRLAPSGRQKIQWVEAHMPLLGKLKEEFVQGKPFKDTKISLSIHLEAKTAYLCEVLAAGGAKMHVTGSNVLSTQDDVAAALADGGINVYALHGASEEEYRRHLVMALSHKPNIIIDDGGDLLYLLHTSEKDLGQDIWGGCEETTTGIQRIKAMEKEGVLQFPMVAVNDAKCKHLFDNRYGTGQSTWDSIMRNTNLIVAGKQAVIAGYGWCGKGIAIRAKALGAKVIVTEVNPISAMEAVMDGFEVMTMEKAAPLGDIFICATGNKNVIALEHIHSMKDLAILTNAGHFNVEIDMESLEEASLEKKELRKNIMGYRLSNGRQVCIIGEGKLVNIAAADGHPAEIMDLSFAVQALSAKYIKEQRGKLPNKLIDVSEKIDAIVAERMLEAWGISIDSLTKEQEKYLNSWTI